ncbi:hypothetical protein KVR801_180011 [Klebsiella variicola]|nr:hypothetical protein KVR801_180011 [Klebsiella variicola]
MEGCIFNARPERSYKPDCNRHGKWSKMGTP